MNFSQSELNSRLREVFESAGYRRYTMSKFEEYDLYARNKDFLISENVLTFTDLDGKLMALKPDVTLSIVKNCRDLSGVQKLYYHENVYRAAGGSLSFREIAQAGLECIGEIDDYCVCEVLSLAAKSLLCISEHCGLDISHLGLLRSLLNSAGLSEAATKEAIRLMGEKNRGELKALLSIENIDENYTERILSLSELEAGAGEASSKLRSILEGAVPQKSLELFLETCDFLSAEFSDTVRVDFSTVGDLSYYSGIIFKGFVDGVPVSVLSGGQYDGLMKKLKTSSRAIGFAIYLDTLEPLFSDAEEFDADVLLIYHHMSSPAEIYDAAKKLGENGRKTVAVRKEIPHGMRFREVYEITEGSVKRLG